MNSKKVFYGMLGAIVLLSALIIATTVMGDKILHKQSEKLVSLKLDNEVIDAQQTSLAQAKKDIKKYNGLKDLAKQIVPQEKDQ
ncbi:MAG: hypothetical protein ABI354_00505, partial [Candidatus Saccharimonadales bacterium]